MSNPYVIFVGHAADNLQPFESAPDEKTAIKRALELKDAFPCTEVVYMPEENLDVNELVYFKYE